MPSLPSDLIFIHTAAAVSRTGEDLLRRLNEPELPQELAVALPVPTGLLLVFGIETGLKALLQVVEKKQIVKGSPLFTHKLTTLWKALLPENRQAVEDRVFAYCTLQNVDVPRVGALLECYQGSFENWRYWEPTRFTDADGTERETLLNAVPGGHWHSGVRVAGSDRSPHGRLRIPVHHAAHPGSRTLVRTAAG